jgi:hypothetical protein
MTVHQSSVNFRNLIRDLAEMYPFEVPEVVVVEVVANALDAKATRVSVDYIPASSTLVVRDNGSGMTASQFDEYHDFAAGLKKRGTGIGFAGLGAKVSFNAAKEVRTHTKGSSFSGGSRWYFRSSKRLVWEELPRTRLGRCGTKVEVLFSKAARVHYSTSDGLLRILRRHYLPLLDPDFLQLYGRLGIYDSDFRFAVNGAVVQPEDVAGMLNLENVRTIFPKDRGKRVGYGIFGIAKDEYPLGTDQCGVLLCTYGKVIKPEFFDQFPGELGPRVFGMVELPGLVRFLTTSKTDFLFKGKHRDFERLIGPVRDEFRSWLKEQGISSMEVSSGNEAARLERELRKLVEEIPELSDFFGFRSRTEVHQADPEGSATVSLHPGAEASFPTGEGTAGAEDAPLAPGEGPGTALVEDAKGPERAKPISRRARRGPKIGFANAPDRVELAWVEGNRVVINSGHAAYLRTRPGSQNRRTHSLFAIASAIQRFSSEQVEQPDLCFIDRMMAAWGRQ